MNSFMSGEEGKFSLHLLLLYSLGPHIEIEVSEYYTCQKTLTKS